MAVRLPLTLTGGSHEGRLSSRTSYLKAVITVGHRQRCRPRDGSTTRLEGGGERGAGRVEEGAIAKGKVGVAGQPHLGETGDAGFAPDAHGVEHHLLSALDGVERAACDRPGRIRRRTGGGGARTRRGRARL